MVDDDSLIILLKIYKAQLRTKKGVFNYQRSISLLNSIVHPCLESNMLRGRLMAIFTLKKELTPIDLVRELGV